METYNLPKTHILYILQDLLFNKEKIYFDTTINKAVWVNVNLTKISIPVGETLIKVLGNHGEFCSTAAYKMAIPLPIITCMTHEDLKDTFNNLSKNLKIFRKEKNQITDYFRLLLNEVETLLDLYRILPEQVATDMKNSSEYMSIEGQLIDKKYPQELFTKQILLAEEIDIIKMLNYNNIQLIKERYLKNNLLG